MFLQEYQVVTKGNYLVNLLGTPWQDTGRVEGIVSGRRGTEPHSKQFSLAVGSPRMCLQLGELSSSQSGIFIGSCSLALLLSSGWWVMGKGWSASRSEQWTPYSQTGWNLKVSQQTVRREPKQWRQGTWGQCKFCSSVRLLVSELAQAKF